MRHAQLAQLVGEAFGPMFDAPAPDYLHIAQLALDWTQRLARAWSDEPEHVGELGRARLLLAGIYEVATARLLGAPAPRPTAPVDLPWAREHAR